MKTKLRRLSKRTISIVLSMVMIITMCVVGMVTVSADTYFNFVHFAVPSTWDMTGQNLYLALSWGNNYYRFYQMTNLDHNLYYYNGSSVDHNSGQERVRFVVSSSAPTNGTVDNDNFSSYTYYTEAESYGLNNSSNYYGFFIDSPDNPGTTNVAISGNWNTDLGSASNAGITLKTYTDGSFSQDGGSVAITGKIFNGASLTQANNVAASATGTSYSYYPPVGTQVTLDANPEDGYIFSGYYDSSDNLLSSSASYSFIAYAPGSSPKEIRAKFIRPVADFYLYGDIGQDAIAEVNGVATSSISGYPAEGSWTASPTEALKVNTGSNGVYSIKIKTKDVSGWDINVGLYQGSASSQRGYKLGDTWYNYNGADYTVPYEGVNDAQNLYIVSGTGSLVLLPDTEYTITIDQTQQLSGTHPYGKITITTNKANVYAVARYQDYDITLSTPAYSSTISNAPAAIGTAVADPAFSVKPFNSTLTATEMSADYEFDGWYTDAACTQDKDTNKVKTVTVNPASGSLTYYALFKEKEPASYTYSAAVSGGNGSVGTFGGTGVNTTTSKVYKGGTLTFVATPNTGYMIDTVTATNGNVAVNKTTNRVTVSNISADTTITVTFKAIPTYTITVLADDDDYGKVSSVSYTNGNGAAATASDITSSTNLTVMQGTTVSLTAAKENSGQFDGWHLVGDYQRSKDTPLSGATITIKPAEDMTVTAYFSKKVTGTSSDYKLNLWPKDSGRGYTNNNLSMSYYENFTYDGKTGLHVAKITPTGTDGTDVFIQAFRDISGTTHYYKNENNGDNARSGWKTFMYDGTVSSGNEEGKFNYDGAGTYTILLYKNPTDDNVQIRVVKEDLDLGGTPPHTGDDDTITTSTYPLLYVFDGIVTRDNNAIKDYGTNKFGNSIILSAKSGVIKTNYYDATEAQQLISTDAGHSEGQLKYYYDPSKELDFRVQTTITASHQAIGVRAFVMNGLTYPAKKSADGVYYADITLDSYYYGESATKDQNTLEVIPVYYNIRIPAKDYIKFYVDANSIGSNWGRTIGYSVWYTDTTQHAETGGYPGQPLMSDGNQLYGYISKYWVDVNAGVDGLPAEEDYNKFSGVLITDLAEHNYTHQNVLEKWGVSKYNKNLQSFDYEDPYYISKMKSVDMIKFDTKYNEYFTSSRYEMFGKDSTVKTSSLTWPSSLDSNKPVLATENFELLKDIDGNPVNIFSEKNPTGGLSDTSPLYVISVGNQTEGSNTWDTTWMIYDKDYTLKAKVHPYELISEAGAAYTALYNDTDGTLKDYKNSKVYILYERNTPGNIKSGQESNTGIRLDGRWLYSRTSDPTTLRLRVAVDDGSGNLTFMPGTDPEDDTKTLPNGISWAEIYNGDISGDYETGDSKTKILNLSNRTTEVTAKINPVGYKVTGMYILSSGFDINTASANNGFSTKIGDYDNLNVKGTATSFTNTRDNRMVIVVEKIPASNLVLYHQMYGGDGAHKIKGFYYTKVEMYDEFEGNLVDTTSSGNSSKYGVFSNNLIELVNFTSDAVKGTGKWLKVTIKTVTTGSSSFYQWYEDNHNAGYDEIDSTAARGKTGELTKELWIDVDNDLYGEEALDVQALYYYSDLQASDSINVNHLLLPATISAGLSGSTYNKVTVVDSSGNAITGGTFAAQAKTTTVPDSFITTENAAAGYQIKVEIWTIPADYCDFGAFYRDTTNEMTTGSVNGIAYTTSQTTTINGETYQKATAMIPISYFYKWDDDGTGTLIQVFDSDKKNVNLYSSLTMKDLNFSFTYQYTSRLYDDQTYTSKGALTPELFKTYFTMDGETLKFQSNAKMQSFIGARAPYEDNYKQTVKWDFSGCDSTATTFSSNTISYATFVAVQAVDREINVEFDLPYSYTAYYVVGETTYTHDVGITITKDTDEDYHSGAEFVKFTGNDSQTAYKPVVEKSGVETYQNSRKGKMQYLDWISLNNVHNSEESGSPEFISTPEKVVQVTGTGAEKTFTELTFQYWSIMDNSDAHNEYMRCYSRDFNMAMYQSSKIRPIYENTEPEGKQAVAATLTYLEDSRNQWNNHGGGTSLPLSKSYWENFGDRIYVDFVLSLELDGQQLNQQSGQTNRAGLLIETVQENLTDGQTAGSYYQSAYALSENSAMTGAAAAVASKRVGTAVDAKYAFSFIDFSKLDNKNSLEYYYTFANVSMTKENEEANAGAGNIVPTEHKNKVYRAFSFVVDASGNVTVSKPVYFTIYNTATIATGTQVES